MSLQHLDEAYIQLSLHEYPELPEGFIRMAVTQRDEPLFDYNVRRILDAYAERLVLDAQVEGDHYDANSTLNAGVAIWAAQAHPSG